MPKPPVIMTAASMPSRWALAGGNAILPNTVLENAWIEVVDRRIVRVGPMPSRVSKSVEVIDVSGKWVFPGFVDIHVHGGDGADFMDGTPDALAVAAAAHLRHGTTTLFPTTTTGPADSIATVIQALKTLHAEERVGLPRLPGIHLYGPFFAPEKSGCHSKSGCRAPETEEYLPYFRSGMVRIATCAAELPGSAMFYRTAKKFRCLVTCGHSNASWSEMAAAHKLGMSHVDHFWCAMSNVASVRNRFGTPMQGSMLEFVLGHESMSTEVIADGFHLAPELVQFAWKLKGPQRLCMVTDSSRGMDMPPGKYLFGHKDENVWIESDGLVGRTAEGGLASALQGMDACVRFVSKHTEIPLHEIVRMASLTPAERTAIDGDVGSLEVGKWADLLVLNRKLELQTVYAP